MASGLERCWQSAGCRALCSSSPTLWMQSTVLFVSPDWPQVAEHFCHSPTHHLGKRERGNVSAGETSHKLGSVLGPTTPGWYLPMRLQWLGSHWDLLSWTSAGSGTHSQARGRGEVQTQGCK